jgi:hypothetical protein
VGSVGGIGSVGVWVCGCVGVWVGVWEYGCAGVWVWERVGVGRYARCDAYGIGVGVGEGRDVSV